MFFDTSPHPPVSLFSLPFLLISSLFSHCFALFTFSFLSLFLSFFSFPPLFYLSFFYISFFHISFPFFRFPLFPLCPIISPFYHFLAFLAFSFPLFSFLCIILHFSFFHFSYLLLLFIPSFSPYSSFIVPVFQHSFSAYVLTPPPPAISLHSSK
jgi:hypothetical protein